MKFPRILYTLLMAAAAVFFAYTLAAKPWLQTDLTALLPQEARPDVLLQKADAVLEKELNGQVVLAVGSADADTAFQTASALARQWQASSVFASVQDTLTPDIGGLRGEIRRLGLALLPSEQQTLLRDNPRAYFQVRAEDAANPFAASLLPLSDDWLGFGRFAAGKGQPQSRIRWNADNGMLFTEHRGKTWVWLRGRLPEGAAPDEKLLKLLDDSKQTAAAQKAEVLYAGGAVFAAEAKTSAEAESRWMGIAGMLLTFALLLRVFRSARVFWLVLPLGAGVLAGLAAALAVFGEIHVLTVVIGTSLVGMLVDFPLHWLAPAVCRPSEKSVSDGLIQKPVWQADEAMRHVLHGFLISLAVTVSGYALLWLTPLSVLQQTAVFSGAALLGAFGATVYWLPPLFRRYHGRDVPFGRLMPPLLAKIHALHALLKKPAAAVLLLILAAAGLWRSDWRDDIRQWAAMPPALLEQARQLGELGGMDFGAQYAVVEAADEDGLLERSAAVNRVLQPLIRQGALAEVQSPDQWIAPQQTQRQLQRHLRALADKPETWQPLAELGVPPKTVQTALQEAAAQAPVSLSDGLKAQIAEAWRPLYLGQVETGRQAAVVRLGGVKDAVAVRTALAGMNGVHWADKRTHLNQMFQETRNQAAWLKLASYAAAWLLLWKIFGTRKGVKILAVPLAAAAGTVALLGWTGIPVSLFAMFGLLLVSAIGVDYAVYAASAAPPPAVRLGGMLLAALTTGISFGLLAFSGTPAVAAFGLTVAVGVVLAVLAAAVLLDEAV
ncbi:hypothetical protein BG910_00325 [Neisseria chenwenguii]|uniref:Membrane transport protein MMPL domain-containing protein n=1 Tax=Neisseria chenwenguii TaxID=1853278 RepID=A0A220RZ00_9NEIS|nr:hypothetical protein BG910_00325 [Neisseria chenwenguii]